MEADAEGTITARNMYGTHLAARTVEGQTCYYLYNAHGDVVMLTDAEDGAIAAAYEYDAFGTLLKTDGYADNSITYAGYQYDEESGLYYLNARYYDSVTARFLTEDTYRGSMDDPLSLNRYTYCYNKPFTYYDPSGHFAWVVVLVAIGKGVAGALIDGGVELFCQTVIEQREEIDWKSVKYSAGVGALTGMVSIPGSSSLGKAGGRMLLSGGGAFVEDVGYQLLVEDKSLEEVDYIRAGGTGLLSGIAGEALEFLPKLGNKVKDKATDLWNGAKKLFNDGFSWRPFGKKTDDVLKDVTETAISGNGRRFGEQIVESENEYGDSVDNPYSGM